ncbi:MAG TPA: class I SAM-dependent methyltransferase [bacterium]|nr:class I SAM-dependent methyltransferase [bacterium]
MPYADVAPYLGKLTVARRAHARVRYASAPLEAVAALVPAGVQAVVELGCSTGVFANVLKARRPDVDVTGVDAAKEKVEAASRTVCGRAGLTFVEDDAFAYVERRGPFEVLAVVDALYLWPPERQDDFVRLAAGKLRPGGYLVVKEMTDRPAWKRRWCAFQEWLAVGVMGLTEGAGVYLRPGEAYRRVMEEAGLAVETFDLSRGYLHPHFALRGRKERNV